MTERVDAASLVLLRVFVGLLVSVSALRYLAKGWVDSLLVAPSFHFRYWGLAWVPIPGEGLTYLLFVLVALAGLTLAAGLAVRLSAALAFAAFTWLELIDLSYYLNHYVFITALLCCFALVPPQPEADGRVAAWKLKLVRAQIGLVYVYAGVAKLGSDWLLDAQPLRIWLARHAGLPLIGAYMDEAWLAYAASWSGALFDLLVVPALLHPRTRAPAYAALVAFHLITASLFPIGLFPWIMIACATIMFAPDWPRRWLGRGSRLARPRPARARLDALTGGLAAALVVVQLALPWRHLAYPGPVAWTEQGARFAYRVMLVEKGGFVEFRVHERASGRRWRVSPSAAQGHAALTPLQVKMMSTRPDMIAAYARHIATHIERTQPGTEVAVYADAFVAVNGRPSARLIDPETDLSAVDDSLAPKPWILAAPEGLR